jgi:hypothetical protein
MNENNIECIVGVCACHLKMKVVAKCEVSNSDIRKASNRKNFPKKDLNDLRMQDQWDGMP